MGSGAVAPPPPHVLIFPYPIQGHINSMLKLAEVLSLANLNITFLNTEKNHDRLVRFTDIETRFSKYPGFQLKTVPDGLSSDNPHTDFMALWDSMEVKTKPILKQMLNDLATSPASAAVDCIIADGLWGFVLDIALELGIPIIHFRTVSACSFWAYFCVPDVIEAGQLPIKGDEDMDRIITTIPGMETFLRCRDLPSFCRDIDNPFSKRVVEATQQSAQTHGLILNTFEDLEGPILSQIRAKCPNIYSIGPLHQHLNVKLIAAQEQQESYRPKSNSLWEENRTCLEWLDSQPPQSVLYVGFGSIAEMKAEQILELWHGLVNSKKRFLWVIRPGTVTKEDGDDQISDETKNSIPKELVEGIVERKEYMVMVGWAPQEEVLGHGAVGGFLTHSGWNSTLESVVGGVPMICCPYFADQQINSRYVEEVWKLGLDMKDVWDRTVVEKMVNDLMVERKEELVKSAATMAELARKSVSTGGISYHHVDRLVVDIRLMNMRKQGEST